MSVTTAYQWTEEKPETEGWYWYEGKNWHRAICIEVFRDGQYWYASEHKADASTWQSTWNMSGRWSNPAASVLINSPVRVNGTFQGKGNYD